MADSTSCRKGGRREEEEGGRRRGVNGETGRGCEAEEAKGGRRGRGRELGGWREDLCVFSVLSRVLDLGLRGCEEEEEGVLLCHEALAHKHIH